MDTNSTPVRPATHSVLDAAKHYTKHDLTPIALDHGKQPNRKRWNEETAGQFLTHYRPGDNIGLRTGENAGGLVDVDLDHPCVLELASRYLPTTQWVSGHAMKPRSHYFYRSSNPEKTRTLKDLTHPLDKIVNQKTGKETEKNVIELRWSELQTMAPPSVHPDHKVECYWEQGLPTTPPPEVDGELLMWQVRLLYCAGLVQPFLTQITAPRHNFFLALAGTLLRASVNRALVVVLVNGLIPDRPGEGENVVKSTEKAIGENDPATGRPTLTATYGVPDVVIDRMVKKLGGQLVGDALLADEWQTTTDGTLPGFQPVQAPNAEQRKSLLTALRRKTKETTAMDYRPQPADLIYGCYEPGHHYIDSGESNTGKTARWVWTAGHWAMSSLPGRDTAVLNSAFLNQKELNAGVKLRPPRGGFVVYITADNSRKNIYRTLARMLKEGSAEVATNDGNGRSWQAEDLAGPGHGGVDRFHVVGQDNGPCSETLKLLNLSTPEGVESIIDYVNGCREELSPDQEANQRAEGLLILDTLSTLSASMDESARDFALLTERLKRIATATRCVVIAVHHVAQAFAQKKDKLGTASPLYAARGPTGLTAGAWGNSLLMNVDGQPNLRLLRYGSNGHGRRLDVVYEVAPPGDPDIYYWKTLHHIDRLRVLAAMPSGNPPTPDEFLDALRRHRADRNLPPDHLFGRDGQDDDELRPIYADAWAKKSGKSRSATGRPVRDALAKAVKVLVEEADLTVVKDGQKIIGHRLTE